MPLETGAVFGALFPTALPLEAASFRFLGFDVVQGFDDPPHGDAAPRVLGGGFGCSPLSCNTLCLQHPVNEYCLLSEWSDAVHAAREFAKAQPEPGSYYIFGVFMMDDAT
ncbi:MAG: hypothetical protein H7Y88_06115 [Phycisphaerales bacterium]|nr:hypothetical protein [Phycisphaerales bacterium]